MIHLQNLSKCLETMKDLCFLRRLKLISNFQLRKISIQHNLELVGEIEKLIEDKKIKPRHNPGIIKTGTIKIPDWIVNSIQICLEDVDKEIIFKERTKFTNYLFSRRLPIESQDLQKKALEIQQNMLPENFQDLSEEEIENHYNEIKGKVQKKLVQSVYNWAAINYDKYNSALYMIARSTPEYSALYSIFNEITVRDPDFDPETIFDFGSGVGSVLWAALDRWKNITEYLGVDISNDMNDLSEKILLKSPTKFKGCYHRQYLPVTNSKYDIVVSAYSLTELPSKMHRLQVISRLWRKTNKYLVIIEIGSNAGFQIVTEARDFVKHMTKKYANESDYFIFAPCPHELSCPRLAEDKQIPCNFTSQYFPLPFLGPSSAKGELYSYVVFKKGERSENDNWYRLVKFPVIRSKHVRCQMCTSKGTLQEAVFTKYKHGKALYRCAKASNWGSRLPVQLPSEDKEQTSSPEVLEHEKQESSADIESKETCDEVVFSSKSPTSFKSED